LTHRFECSGDGPSRHFACAQQSGRFFRVNRTREYLTDGEVARLQEAAKANRWGQRDATMILVA